MSARLCVLLCKCHVIWGGVCVKVKGIVQAEEKGNLPSSSRGESIFNLALEKHFPSFAVPGYSARCPDPMFQDLLDAEDAT